MISGKQTVAYLAVNIRVALFYFLGAQLGFLFSVTANPYTTLFWPPAGLALGALLLHGNRALAGIFIGAFATHLTELSGSPLIPWIFSSAFFCFGAVLSAKAAIFLLKRYAHSAPIYSCSADIFTGSLLMAAASSVAAFLGNSSMLASGVLAADSVPLTFTIWWTGNFFGMLIVTPLAFSIGQRLRPGFFRSVESEVIPAPTAMNSCFGVIAILAFSFLWHQEGVNTSAMLQQEARVSADNIHKVLLRAGRDMESIEALVSASEKQLDSGEFLRYTEALHMNTTNHPAVSSVIWAPLVHDIAAWESEMLSKYPDLRAFDQSPTRENQLVGRRENYYPSQYIYSPSGVLGNAVGYDLGSDSINRQAIERASRTGEPGMVAPMTMSDAASVQRPALLICASVHRDSVPVSARLLDTTFILGVACGIYPIQAILEMALSNTLPSIVLHIFDVDGIREGEWYYSHAADPGDLSAGYYATPNPLQLSRSPHGTADIVFGGSQWRVFALQSRNVSSEFRSVIPWAALLLILALGIGLSSVLMDRIITRRKIRVETGKTLDALHKARAANEAKSYFMTAASHDIKQPLYALSILADTLLLSNPLKDTLPLISSLKTSITEMSIHFDTLMDAGRFQDGSFEIHTRDFPLQELTRRIETEIAPLCAEKRLQWILDLENCIAHSDPELIMRLLRNLLINAVRFTDSGTVSCSARRTDGKICFTIIDTGQGLSDAQKALIFSEVVRLRGDTIHTSGLGLGLSIVNKISRSLDLDLTLESSEGAGTQYVFFLPLAASDETE